MHISSHSFFLPELNSMREKARSLESALADRDAQLRVAREEASRALQQHTESEQRTRIDSTHQLEQTIKARDEAMRRAAELDSAVQERQRVGGALQQQLNEQRMYQERLEADVSRSRDQLDQAVAQRDEARRTLERTRRDAEQMRDTLGTVTNEKSALVEQLRQREAALQKLQNELHSLQTTDAMRDAHKQAQAAAEHQRMEELLAEKDDVIGSIQRINQQLYSEQNKLKGEQQLAQRMIEENLNMVAELETAMEQLINDAETHNGGGGGGGGGGSEEALRQVRAEAENLARMCSAEIARMRDDIASAAPPSGLAGQPTSLEELQERKILQLLAALDSLTHSHEQHLQALAKARLLDAELRAEAHARQQIADKYLDEKQSYLAQLESELNRNGALLTEVTRARELLRADTANATVRQVLERLDRLETQEELAAQRTRQSEVATLLVDSRLDRLRNNTPLPALPSLTPDSADTRTIAMPPASPAPSFADVPLTPAPPAASAAAGVPTPAASKLATTKPVKEKGGSNCIVS